jgi:Cu2+-exporting ATPase
MPSTKASVHVHDPHAGPDKHAGHSVAMFRDKFWGTAVARDLEHTIAQGTVKSGEGGASCLGQAPSTSKSARRQRPSHRGWPSAPHRRPDSASTSPRAARYLRSAIDRAAARGQAAITMIEGTTPLAVLAVADAIREESRNAVQRLHEQGVGSSHTDGTHQGYRQCSGRANDGHGRRP